MNAANTPPIPARTRRPRAVLAALITAILIATLAGCGVRLETPPLTEPEPDALEISRRAAVGDVLAIRDTIAVTLESLDAEDPSGPILEEILISGAVHLEQLGGVYVSGLDPDPEATRSAEPGVGGSTTAAGVDAVVDRLEQAYARGRGALESAPDPGLARLIASIAANNLASARALALASDLDLPTTAERGPPLVPSEPLAGLSSSWLTPIILAEDGTGYLYEVLAARLQDKARKRALTRAGLHRARAEAAAQSAQVSGSAQDPRRAAYTLPEGILADPPKKDTVRESEFTLTDSYAALITQVDPADREAFFDLMVESYLSALTWGADQETFPGLREKN